MGGPTWRYRGRPVVGVRGIRRCTKVHGVLLIFVGGESFERGCVLIGQAKVNRGGRGHGAVRRTW